MVINKLNTKAYLSAPVGITFNYQFGKYFTLKSGLEYVRYIDRFDVLADISGETPIKIDFVYYYDYLGIPILLNFTTRGKVKFFANTGLIPSLLINSDRKMDEEEEKVYGDLYKLEFKKLHTIYTISAGIIVPIAERFDISVGIRENAGLTYLNSDVHRSQRQVISNSFGLIAGISYNL